jgi:hypothetical protein
MRKSRAFIYNFKNILSLPFTKGEGREGFDAL